MNKSDKRDLKRVAELVRLSAPLIQHVPKLPGMEFKLVNNSDLEPFYLSTTMVTIRVWHHMMSSWFVPLPVFPQRPKTDVTECETSRFVDRFNTKSEEVKIGTPTEEQWIAAFGSSDPADEDKDSGLSLGDVAWYKGNSDGRPHPVATKEPVNGFFDLLGNAWEWTWTRGVEDPRSYVVVGGSFRSAYETVEFHHRRVYDQNVRSQFIGFRLILSALDYLVEDE